MEAGRCELKWLLKTLERKWDYFMVKPTRFSHHGYDGMSVAMRQPLNVYNIKLREDCDVPMELSNNHIPQCRKANSMSNTTILCARCATAHRQINVYFNSMHMMNITPTTGILGYYS